MEYIFREFVLALGPTPEMFTRPMVCKALVSSDLPAHVVGDSGEAQIGGGGGGGGGSRGT
jgi:hypothetical protein